MQRLRTAVLTLVLMLLAFGGGFIPKEIETRRMTTRLESADLELRLATLHRQIGMASHEAQRNNFAAAAASARTFFDGCRAVLDEHEMIDRPRTRLALSAYASSSDMVLGQLATADPAVKERLASLFLTMNGLLERRQ